MYNTYLKLTNSIGFCSGQLILRKVSIHLISIKVSIIALAVGIVKTKSLFSRKNSGLKSEQEKEPEATYIVHTNYVSKR